jgi:hypothetical protein
VTRIPLRALLSVLPEPPSPERLEAARIADLRAQWFEAEARRADGDGLATIAAAHGERARAYRRETLDALGLRP